MDSKKLARVIEIIVKKEIKKQLPQLVKEGVAKVLKENKQVVSRKTEVLHEEEDMFSLAESVLDQERKTKKPTTPQKTFSKNPVLNEILNDTKPFNQGTALDENNNDMDKTLTFDSNGAPAGIDAIRSQMAAKMGYGDMGSKGPQAGGLGVETGVPVMDKVLNRDYSELVKRFKK